MLPAKIVADYIISQNDPNGWEITNLKLQKLLYYCQGFYLAIKDDPMFNERIEHWDNGPVVPEMYEEYKKYERITSGQPGTLDLDSMLNDSFAKKTIDENLKIYARFYDSFAREIIDEVLKIYGHFSSWKLREMTRNEPPWVNTKCCEEITHQSLKDYFITRVK